ncbi:MAG: dihydrodipicolinate synthase family protein [Lachnospiraceae bacterium]|nr:dihydrodipicolinate synthase family protein [Lachnospiraceae bacterium]
METFGSWVASVTPFDERGQVDPGALRALVEFHVANGTNTLFFMGSTGEVNMLTEEERRLIVRETVKAAAGRIKIWCGATFPTTEKTVAFAQYAESEGADGLVFAAPAYTMPNQEMLKEFSRAAISSVKIPCGLYLNPARTGVMLEVASLKELKAACDNLVVIKEGHANVRHLEEVAFTLGDKVAVCGVDALSCSNAMASLTVGGRGLNNAVGNVLPRETAVWAKPWETMDDVLASRNMYEKLYPVLKALNSVVAPVCFKAAMRLYGLPVGGVRGPLQDLTGEPLKALEKTLEDFGAFDTYGRA